MFREYLERNQDILLRQLESSTDLQKSYGHIASFLRNMQNECTTQLQGDRLKEICRAVIDVVISALSCIQSASEVNTLLEPQNAKSTQSTDKKTTWWYYIGVIISIGLAMHFIFSGSLIAATVCGALSFWQVIVLQHVKINSITSTEQPEIVSSVKLNVNDFMRRFSLCIAVMDEQLRNLFANVPHQTSNMQWTNEAMKILQVLWCEENKGDGKKLSDIVRKLFKCLKDEGLIISEYTSELDSYFDKMPGRRDGETLSPVFMRDNRVFVRGIIIQNQYQ